MAISDLQKQVARHALEDHERIRRLVGDYDTGAAGIARQTADRWQMLGAASPIEQALRHVRDREMGIVGSTERTALGMFAEHERVRRLIEESRPLGWSPSAVACADPAWTHGVTAATSLALGPLSEPVCAHSKLTARAMAGVDSAWSVRQLYDTWRDPSMQAHLREARAALESYYSSKELRAFRLFARLGLVGLENIFTREEAIALLHRHRTKGAKGVYEYVRKKFRSRRYQVLNTLMRAWWNVPYMNKRKAIVRAAVAAHKRREYALSIPALLPLVDGLANEIIPVPAGKKAKPIRVKEAAALYKEDDGRFWVAECVQQVVNALAYKKYDFSNAKRAPSSINRHAVLHGRIDSYASEMNSCKTILLLDVMVRILLQRQTGTKAGTKNQPPP